MQNTCLFYIVSQVLKVFEDCTSYKKLHDTTSPFASCCFTYIYTSADMTFYKFLELHSPLSEKIFLSQILLF